jgi:hypothetical protein
VQGAVGGVFGRDGGSGRRWSSANLSRRAEATLP